MKASTLFFLILALDTAASRHGLAPDAHAQTRDAARASAAATAARTTLRGRVVYADTGNPVRRADVTLTDAATGETRGGAVTNVKGEFILRNVAAGRYTLSAAAPGLVEPESLYSPEDSADVLDLAEQPSTLAEVEPDGTSDADVLIRARRGGAITGRVTSEDGEPVAGAQVKLFRAWRGRLARVNSTWRAFSEDKKFLTTDSRGVYRLAGLPAGEYVVRASESDLDVDAGAEEGDPYGDGSLVVSYFPSAAAVKDAAKVVVYEGRDTDGVDIRLPDRPVRRLAGTVTLKRGGAPVRGAEVVIERKDEGPARRASFGDGAARTDEHGRWEVRGVPDGEYVVTASGVASVSVVEDGRNRWLYIIPARREATISGADVTDLKLEAEEGGRVTGTVSVEGGGALPENLYVHASRNGADGDLSSVRDGGRFEMDTVPAGEVRLRVAGFPAERFYVKSLTWNQVDLLREPLRVGERAAVEGVRVVLSPDVATLNGQAFSRRDNSSPLARAVVALVPADEKLRRSAARSRVVRADAKGRFKLTGPPGEYLVIALNESAARGQSAAPDEEFIRRALPALTRVTLRPGATVSGVKVFGVEE